MNPHTILGLHERREDILRLPSPPSLSFSLSHAYVGLEQVKERQGTLWLLGFRAVTILVACVSVFTTHKLCPTCLQAFNNILVCMYLEEKKKVFTYANKDENKAMKAYS